MAPRPARSACHKGRADVEKRWSRRRWLKWRLFGGGEEDKDKVEINACGQKAGDTKRLKFGCKLSPRWLVHVETGDGTNGRDKNSPGE